MAAPASGAGGVFQGSKGPDKRVYDAADRDDELGLRALLDQGFDANSNNGNPYVSAVARTARGRGEWGGAAEDGGGQPRPLDVSVAALRNAPAHRRVYIIGRPTSRPRRATSAV